MNNTDLLYALHFSQARRGHGQVISSLENALLASMLSNDDGKGLSHKRLGEMMLFANYSFGNGNGGGRRKSRNESDVSTLMRAKLLHNLVKKGNGNDGTMNISENDPIQIIAMMKLLKVGNKRIQNLLEGYYNMILINKLSKS